MELLFVAVAVGIASGVLPSLVLKRSLRRIDDRLSKETMSVNEDVAHLSSDESLLSTIQKIELPETFTVKAKDLDLSFERVDKNLGQNDYSRIVDQLRQQNYVEVELDELRSILASTLEQQLLSKYQGKTDKEMKKLALLANSLVGTLPAAVSFYSLLSGKNGLYTLNRKLQFGEQIVRYFDGTYSSIVREMDGKFTEHVGYIKLDRLKNLLMMQFVWLVGNFVFGTLNLSQINQTLKRVEQGIKIIIEKFSIEKSAKLKTLRNLLEEMWRAPSADPVNYFELKMYRKEVLELYYYYLSDIESILNKEIKTTGFTTAQKLREVDELLETSRVAESSFNLALCVRTLKLVEFLMLRSLLSRSHATSMSPELVYLFDVFKDEKYIVSANERINALRLHLTNTLRTIYDAAWLNKERVAERMKDIDDFLREVVSETEEITVKLREINQRLQALFSKKMDLVLLIESGRPRVFAKLLD